MKQDRYNKEHGITPKQIVKNMQSPLSGMSSAKKQEVYEEMSKAVLAAASPEEKYSSRTELQKAAERAKSQMLAAAKDMDYILAAHYRDELKRLETRLANMGAGKDNT